jgi:hypothetical protein
MSNHQRTPIHEVFYGEPVAESGGKPGKAKKKQVGEAKAKRGGADDRNRSIRLRVRSRPRRATRRRCGSCPWRSCAPA